jgi:uncharacterized protein YgiB involved in biofilm formation
MALGETAVANHVGSGDLLGHVFIYRWCDDLILANKSMNQCGARWQNAKLSKTKNNPNVV